MIPDESFGECPKEDKLWDLLAKHTNRKYGKTICTLCGMPYEKHFKPWPETFATLVITCAGVPIKL